MGKRQIPKTPQELEGWAARVLGTTELALLSADADKIKSYVFESSKLPEIRGGSMILDDLNVRGVQRVFRKAGVPSSFMNEDPPGCLIYAGGGSLLALVPRDLAEELEREIEALYPKETDVATVTCVSAPITELATLHSDFPQLMDIQTMLLRQRKDQRESFPFIETLPHQRRCESCGARPAARFRDRPPERWLCTACDKKVARGGKGYWTKRFEKRLQHGLPGVDSTVYQGAASDFESVRPALDLSEIVIAGDSQTIGFIYADGDGVGHFIESSRSLQEYHEKSRVLAELLPDLVYTALAHHLHVGAIERKDEGKVFIHPFEIITIGGDDLLLIVPGTVALPIALEIGMCFAENIEKRFVKWENEFSWKRPKQPLTMSAGVVIADQHNPIRFVQDLADQLLKNAKRQARESKEQGNGADGAVDFIVLKSQSMLASDLSDLRHRVYQFSPQPNEQIWLTGRPYLWCDVRKLLAHARLLRDTAYPRTQVQALRRVLREGRRLGRLWPSMWYIRQQLRVSGIRRAVMQRIDQDWSTNVSTAGNAPPWNRLPPKKNVERYMTVWEDLHEVRELLPKLEREPDDIRRQAESLKQEVLSRVEQEEVYGG